jgi:hypothetical protein
MGERLLQPSMPDFCQTKDISKLKEEMGALTVNAAHFQQELLTRLEDACRERDEARAKVCYPVDITSARWICHGSRSAVV